MDQGFFSSLFDLSFTRLITTRIIKVVYVITMIMIGLTALVFIAAAFEKSAGTGVLTLLVIAPLFSLIYVIYARVFLEFIIQVFRIAEATHEQNAMQREAFTAAGWLRFDPNAAPAAVPVSEIVARSCPHCGEPTSPGAQFCRSCGKPLA